MGKTASSGSKSTTQPARRGTPFELNGLTTECNFAESSNRIFSNNLIYVHANSCFYYKCTNNQSFERNAGMNFLSDGGN
jgi:hypothetical protein